MEEKPKQLGGVTGKGFLPGRSGNPGGRPQGLAERVRRATKNGKTIVDFMISVARGMNIDGRKPRLGDRVDAVKWLADRGWGRAIQGVERGFDGGQFRDRVTFVIPDNGRDPRPPPVALPDGDTGDMDQAGESGG